MMPENAPPPEAAETIHPLHYAALITDI
jgi:hypothetical protein